MFETKLSSKVVVAARNQDVIDLVADAVGHFGYGVAVVGSGPEVIAAVETGPVAGLFLDSLIPSEPGKAPTWLATARTVGRLCRRPDSVVPPVIMMTQRGSQQDFEVLTNRVCWLAQCGAREFIVEPDADHPWTASPETMLRLASCIPMRQQPFTPADWWTRMVWEGAHRSTREVLEDIEHLYSQTWELRRQAAAADDPAQRDVLDGIAEKQQLLAMTAARKHTKRLLYARMNWKSRQHRRSAALSVQQ